MAISDTIREILKSRNIQQSDLAKQLGMSKQNFSNRMARGTFSPDELARLADILGMKLGFLEDAETGDMTFYQIGHSGYTLEQEIKALEPCKYSATADWEPVTASIGKSDIRATGLNGEPLEHSMVITNFVSMVARQLDEYTRVFPNNIHYAWKQKDGAWESVCPDASIVWRLAKRRGKEIIDMPQFVMEVVSLDTEEFDRTKKMRLYESKQISEFWIVDWRNRTIEIYDRDAISEHEGKYYLLKTVTESNKDGLHMFSMPNIAIDFDQLFDMEF